MKYETEYLDRLHSVIDKVEKPQKSERPATPKEPIVINEIWTTDYWKTQYRKANPKYGERKRPGPVRIFFGIVLGIIAVLLGVSGIMGMI